jgi:cytochrome P450
MIPYMQPEHLTKLGKMFGIQSFLDKVQFRVDAGKLVKDRFALEQQDKPESEKRKDFFHFLYHAKNPETGESFKPQDLGGEAALLIGAGADTSSTASSAFFFYILRNANALKKLQQEVRTAFNDVSEITYSAKLTGLTYLKACIDEAMRLAPPVPGLLDRLVLPGGAMVDGHEIPAGTVVGVAAYAAHHNETYFPKPFEYIPERWIASGESSHTAGFTISPQAVEAAKSAFHPFSSGPRGCVGKNMAYMELFTAIASAIFLFDMELKTGDRSGEGGSGHWAGVKGRQRTSEYQLVDWLISDREGPIVNFRRREGVSLAAVAA